MDPPLFQAPPTVPYQNFDRPLLAQDWEYQIAKVTDLHESDDLKSITEIMEEQPFPSFPSFAVDLPPSQTPLAVSQQIFHRPQSAQDWEKQKAIVTDLNESNELRDTSEISLEQLLAPFPIDRSLNQAPPTAPQLIFNFPQLAQDWEKQKGKVTDLNESDELEGTTKMMEEQSSASFAIDPLWVYESNDLTDTMETVQQQLIAPFAMDPPPSQAPLTLSQQTFHRPQLAQDWENQKAKITNLYESKELKETMKIMEEQHGFKATLNQYKKQIGKWGLDNKRIKDFEYQAMLKKKRKREQEDPYKESAFRLRGAKVDSSKISRYKKRKGAHEDDVRSDVGTPSDLSCYTPSVISSPAPPSLEYRSTGNVNANVAVGLGSATNFDTGNPHSFYTPSFSQFCTDSTLWRGQAIATMDGLGLNSTTLLSNAPGYTQTVKLYESHKIPDGHLKDYIKRLQPEELVTSIWFIHPDTTEICKEVETLKFSWRLDVKNGRRSYMGQVYFPLRFGVKALSDAEIVEVYNAWVSHRICDITRSLLEEVVVRVEGKELYILYGFGDNSYGCVM